MFGLRQSRDRPFTITSCIDLGVQGIAASRIREADKNIRSQSGEFRGDLVPLEFSGIVRLAGEPVLRLMYIR